MRSRKQSKERRPWLEASGVSRTGQLMRFNVDMVGDNYVVTQLNPLKVWREEPDRRATEDDVRRELEEEFRLENVKIEAVRFKELPSGLKILER